MKKNVSYIMALSFLLVLSACGNDTKNVDWTWSKKTAREIHDDGWVYTFEYSFSKDGSISGMIPYTFYGINLRYRYNDDYTTTVNVNENGQVVSKSAPQTIQILGQSNSENIKNDMAYLDELWISNEMTNEKLLSLTPEDIPFKELDKELFLGLVKTALNGEDHREGNYTDLPTYALLTEPEYLDGYKYQIGFLTSMGCVDVMFIDVLYENGSAYNDYIQLSDLVDAKAESPEQLKAYKLIEDLSAGIVNDNNLLYAYEQYHDALIADLDFSRLYSMLQDIESLDINKYVINSNDLIK